MDDEAQTKRESASAPPSNKNSIYMDREAEDIVHTMNIVDLNENTRKEREETMNQQHQESARRRRGKQRR